MAGAKVATHEAAVLNVNRSTTLTGYAAYAGLLTAAATDTTTGTEVSGSSYARVACGFSAPTGSAPSSMTTPSDINFPIITTTGYSPVQIGVYTASTAGVLNVFVPSFTAVALAVGGRGTILAGQLVLTEE